MALDLTKPVIRKGNQIVGGIGRVVGTIDATYHNVGVAFRYHGSSDAAHANKEYIVCMREDELANPPESRWLNVYDQNGAGVYPRWVTSREKANGNASTGRIAVIEDKQDGSEWIIHKVGN